MAITKEQCEAKGWFWNETKQQCRKPEILKMTMTLTRGPNCDGNDRRVSVEKPKLSAAVKKALLKAGGKKKAGG